MMAVVDFESYGNSLAVKVAMLVQLTVMMLMIWVVEKFEKKSVSDVPTLFTRIPISKQDNYLKMVSVNPTWLPCSKLATTYFQCTSFFCLLVNLCFTSSILSKIFFSFLDIMQIFHPSSAKT